MTTFYKNYIRLCAKKDVSPSAAAEAVGLSRTSPNGWKKGKNPNDSTLVKLALYFEVSVAELIDEPKEKSPTPEGVELDAETIELNEIWSTASESERTALLEMARFIKSRRRDNGIV